MLNIGAGEVVVILLIALLVLGPDKLPSTARTIGKTMQQLRRMSSGFEREVRAAMQLEDLGGSTPSTSSPATTSGVHPGLGRGPRLGPGEVQVSSQASSQAGSQAGSPSVSPSGSPPPVTGQFLNGDGPDGPSESFS
jgi:sec-independent protein translocase protein TatB